MLRCTRIASRPAAFAAYNAASAAARISPLVFIDGSGKRLGKKELIDGWMGPGDRYDPAPPVDRVIVPLGRDAAVVASCAAEFPGSVVVDTGFGRRVLPEADGELLPRIC